MTLQRGQPAGRSPKWRDRVTVWIIHLCIIHSEAQELGGIHVGSLVHCNALRPSVGQAVSGVCCGGGGASRGQRARGHAAPPALAQAPFLLISLASRFCIMVPSVSFLLPACNNNRGQAPD